MYQWSSRVSLPHLCPLELKSKVFLLLYRLFGWRTLEKKYHLLKKLHCHICFAKSKAAFLPVFHFLYTWSQWFIEPRRSGSGLRHLPQKLCNLLHRSIFPKFSAAYAIRPRPKWRVQHSFVQLALCSIQQLEVSCLVWVNVSLLSILYVQEALSFQRRQDQPLGPLKPA